jgi:hypothetical protein
MCKSGAKCALDPGKGRGYVAYTARQEDGGWLTSGSYPPY